MSDVLLGCIAIGVTIILGLVAIAIGVFSGLRGFSTGVKDELTAIKVKVTEIQVTTQNVWDVFRRNPIWAPGGTVERELKNIGKIKIIAEPHLEKTIYFIEATNPMLDDDRIIQLSKKTDLESKEIEMFGKLPQVNTPIPTRLVMRVPCTDAKTCTEYMNYFRIIYLTKV